MRCEKEGLANPSLVFHAQEQLELTASGEVKLRPCVTPLLFGNRQRLCPPVGLVRRFCSGWHNICLVRGKTPASTRRGQQVGFPRTRLCRGHKPGLRGHLRRFGV